VANVLSTTRRAPAAAATCASAVMSAMPSSGLVGVSVQMTLVFGRTAARAAPTSARSTVVYSTPQSAMTLSSSRNVPPYASPPRMTWSPGRVMARSAMSAAAMPDANESACLPPSSEASASSSAVRVGFAVREYSYPPSRRPPTPSWAKVDVA
jgi:hypothetical protein